jgi:hypothetical protein
MVARSPVKPWHRSAMWVSGRMLWGLWKMLGVSAGCGKTLASELHGGGAMVDSGRRKPRTGTPGVPFIGGTTWRRVQGSPRVEKPARVAMGQCRPRRPRRRRMAARRLDRICAQGPSSGGGAARVADGSGDATS